MTRIDTLFKNSIFSPLNPATRRFIKYPDIQAPRTVVSRQNSIILAPPFPDTLPIGKYRIDCLFPLTPSSLCLARSCCLSFCISLPQVENNNFQPFLSLPSFSHVRSLSTPLPLISPHRSFSNTPFFFLRSGLFPLNFFISFLIFLISSTSAVHTRCRLFLQPQIAFTLFLGGLVNSPLLPPFLASSVRALRPPSCAEA